MKIPDSDELKAEYDFSRGERGRYADRFQEGVRVREYGDPHSLGAAALQTQVAEALADAQRVEFSLFLLSTTGGTADTSPSGVIRWRAVLEQHLAEGTEFAPALPELADQLAQFAKMRSWLVHESLLRRSTTAAAAESKADLLQFRVLCERLLASANDVANRIAAQPDRERWLEVADVVIPNTGSLEDLDAAVRRLWADLKGTDRIGF